jgi:hypothetical protein
MSLKDIIKEDSKKVFQKNSEYSEPSTYYPKDDDAIEDISIEWTYKNTSPDFDVDGEWQKSSAQIFVSSLDVSNPQRGDTAKNEAGEIYEVDSIEAKSHEGAVLNMKLKTQTTIGHIHKT